VKGTRRSQVKVTGGKREINWETCTLNKGKSLPIVIGDRTTIKRREGCIGTSGFGLGKYQGNKKKSKRGKILQYYSPGLLSAESTIKTGLCIEGGEGGCGTI